jgi:hypothetical protein
MNVESVPAHFQLADTVYFLTRTHAGLTELYTLDEFAVYPICELGPVEEVIPVRNDRPSSEVLFRLAGNRFVRFSGGGVVGLEVEIEQG